MRGLRRCFGRWREFGGARTPLQDEGGARAPWQDEGGGGFDAEGVAERAKDATQRRVGFDQGEKLTLGHEVAQGFGGAADRVRVGGGAGVEAVQPVEIAGQDVGGFGARRGRAGFALAQGTVVRDFHDEGAEAFDAGPGEEGDDGGQAEGFGFLLSDQEAVDPVIEPAKIVDEGFARGSHGGIGPQTQGGEKGGWRVR